MEKARNEENVFVCVGSELYVHDLPIFSPSQNQNNLSTNNVTLNKYAIFCFRMIFHGIHWVYMNNQAVFYNLW